MTYTAEDAHHHLSLRLDASDPGPRPHISTTIGVITGGIAVALLGGVIAKHVADPAASGPVMVTVGVMLLLSVVVQCSVSWYLDHRAAARLTTAAARRDAEQDAAMQRLTETLHEEIRQLAETLRDEVHSQIEAGARLTAAAAVSAVREEIAAKTAVDDLAAEFAAYRERVDSDLAGLILARAPKGSVVAIDTHRH